MIYLLGGAAIFIILFEIRASEPIINPIVLAVVITITILPVPSLLTQRGMSGQLELVLSILLVIHLLGLVVIGSSDQIGQVKSPTELVISSIKHIQSLKEWLY